MKPRTVMVTLELVTAESTDELKSNLIWQVAVTTAFKKNVYVSQVQVDVIKPTKAIKAKSKKKKADA